MNDRTIIYYTSNREEVSFEKKIRKRLLENSGGLPIISVSQKPIKLGANICIGVHKPTNVLLYYQVLQGLKAAKTPFVISAEADFLYPPEYFTFVPPKIDAIYRYGNIRLMWKDKWGFFRKKYSEGAQIAGREHLISIIEKALKGLNIYEESPKFNKFNPYWGLPLKFFGGEVPCVTFKTGDSLHRSVVLEKQRSLYELPYWGSAIEMREKMFSINNS